MSKLPNPEEKMAGDAEGETPEGDATEWLNLVLPVKKLSDREIKQVSPTALAYVGDAIYELFVRASYLRPPKRQQIYHNQVVSQVRAESQALMLRSLQPLLSSTELEIVKRGRNAATGGPRRIDPGTYKQASSLETLMGYLYLRDPERLIFLLSQLKLEGVECAFSGEAISL